MKHGESGVLQVVDMTGENLLRTLEYAIQADNDIRGWFYYFSGLKMTYAPSAIPGKRIIKNVLGKTRAECKAKLKKAIEESQSLDVGRADEYTVAMAADVV